MGKGYGPSSWGKELTSLCVGVPCEQVASGRRPWLTLHLLLQHSRRKLRRSQRAAFPEEKDSGFFMLRKDSERRATLHRILTEDQDKVVRNLMESLAQVKHGGHFPSWRLTPFFVNIIFFFFAKIDLHCVAQAGLRLSYSIS